MWTDETWRCRRQDCRHKRRTGECDILIEINTSKPCAFFQPRVFPGTLEIIDGIEVRRDSHSLVYLREVKK